MDEKLKEIKDRFNNRLHDSNLYGEFLKHHETDIAELLKEVEHWKMASKYNLNVCRNQSDLIGELHRVIKQYEELIGAIANIDGAFITGEGECDYTDKQALDKIMKWVDPVWNKITQSKRRL